MDKDQKFFVLFGVFVIIVVALLIFYYFATSDNKEFVLRDKDSFTSQQDYLNYLEEYKQAMSKDTYGGKTPEETLELFVNALKKGDTELASKYFVLDEQKQIKEDMDKGLKNDGIKNFLNIISDLSNKFVGEKSTESDYFISVINKENQELVMELTFSLNESTNLWKIESL